MMHIARCIGYLCFVFPAVLFIELTKAVGGIASSVSTSTPKRAPKNWWASHSNSLDNDIEQLRHVDGLKGR